MIDHTETSNEGLKKGAHPTAPGGMSEAALAVELVEKHGWTMREAKALKWPAKIDAVVAGRKEREAEAATPTEVETDDDLLDLDEDDELLAMFDEEEDEPGATSSTDEPVEADDDDLDDLDDLDALFEEIAEAQPKSTLFVPIPGTKDYRFNNHAGAGPSASERWMSCTASLGLSRDVIESMSPYQQVLFANSSSAARQGTTAHTAAEAEARLLLGELTRAEVDATLLELTLNPEVEAEAYSEEMGEYIVEYLDLIRSYINTGREVDVERRVTAVIPLTAEVAGEDVYEIPGSADAVVFPSADERELVIADLKYGDGIDVDVMENSQARIYGIGVLSELADEDGNLPDLDRIVYHIIQPRLGGIKTWTESIDDLLTWRDEELSPALTAALLGTAGGATFVPSEKACNFCPARGSCPALTEERMNAAQEIFDIFIEEGAFPETSSLSNERLGSLLNQIAGLVDLHADLKEEAQRRLYRGEEVPGRDLRSYTPPRKWKPGAELDLSSIKELFKPPTLLTPTQALKVLGKGNEAKVARVEAVIETPARRPVISTGPNDKRAVWVGRDPADMFDIEED